MCCGKKTRRRQIGGMNMAQASNVAKYSNSDFEIAIYNGPTQELTGVATELNYGTRSKGQQMLVHSEDLEAMQSLFGEDVVPEPEPEPAIAEVVEEEDEISPSSFFSGGG